MTIAKYNRKVTKRNRNKRTPIISSSGNYTSSSTSSSSSSQSGSYANLLTENIFNESQLFKKNISITGDATVGGNVNVSGVINSYSQDELNIGDSWINLATQSQVDIDSGIKIYGENSSLKSTLFYDVSADNWNVDKDFKISKTSASIILNETDYVNSNASIQFKNNVNQNCIITHEISDSEIVGDGQALIIKSENTPTHPLHIEIDGDYYTNNNKVWHYGNFSTSDVDSWKNHVIDNSQAHSDYLTNNAVDNLSFTNNSVWQFEAGVANNHGLMIENQSSISGTGAQLKLRGRILDSSIVSIGTAANVGTLQFWVENSLGLAINQDGYVGFGYSDPIVKVEIADTFLLSRSAARSQNIYMYSSSTGNVIESNGSSKNLLFNMKSAGGFYFQENGTSKVSIVGGNLNIYNNIKNSTTFSSGFAGSGWQIDNTNSATFDNLTIRKSMQIYELNINKIRSGNGSYWFNDGGKIVHTIINNLGGAQHTTYYEKESGGCPFVVGDIVRCQSWNGNSIKYYEAEVSTVGDSGTYDDWQYANLATATLLGDDIPEVGDEVVKVDSVVSSRRGSVYITSNDNDAPFMDVVVGDGVVGGNFTNKARIGKLDGITDSNAGLDGTQTDYYGLYTSNGHFSGHIHSTSGNIAGWDITENYIENGGIRIATENGGVDGAEIRISSDKYGNGTNNFVRMYYGATGDNWGIQGFNDSVESFYFGEKNGVVSNQIAGTNFNSTSIYSSSTTLNGVYASSGFILNKDGSFRTKNFAITSTGDLYAQNGTFENVDISGRIATGFDDKTIGDGFGAPVTGFAITPTTNNIRIVVNNSTSTCALQNLTITKGSGTWVDGQIFRLFFSDEGDGCWYGNLVGSGISLVSKNVDADGTSIKYATKSAPSGQGYSRSLTAIYSASDNALLFF